MTYSRANLLGWILLLTAGLWAAAAQAQEFRYRYVSLDNIEPPAPYTVFFPVSLRDGGRVYGTVCDDVCSDPHIAIYKNGTLTVLGAAGLGAGDFAIAVNARGTLAGAVLIDPENFIFQAALFRGDQVELLPRQPGEIFSVAFSLNDRDMALVESDTATAINYLLYKDGQASPLDFGPAVTNPELFLSRKSINNHGIIAGRSGEAFNGARGFRFDPRTGQAKLLYPFPGDPTETLAWGMGINNRGDVLGYSFTVGVQPYHERIGVWDSTGRFRTYSVSSISTNRLVFNDNNLIVATLAGGTSYLIPRPGVRFDLADLVENLPQGADLSIIDDLNNRSDMIGFGSGGSFLLERITNGTPRSFVASRPISSAKSKRHIMPPKAAAILRRQLPSLDELK
jgi:hypothetical protein